jgi:hypothetical protein
MMSKLLLDLNCLCMMATDPPMKTVHVLMPTTGHGEGSPRAPHHVVRLFHPRLDEPVGLEHWGLVLGSEHASADTTLTPLDTPHDREEIADLSKVTRKRLDRRLIGDKQVEEVVSRITLRSGRVLRLEALASWTLKGRRIFMAHRVIWRIDDFRDGPLTWVPLGATGDPPLRALPPLQPSDQGVHRVSVYHVTKQGLPPNTGRLKAHEVKEHYRAFYRFFGITNPGDDLLPGGNDGEPEYGYTCPGGRAELKRPPKA